MKLAVLGTESDAGKTHIVSGLCWILIQKNKVSIFPFKGQNMSLNAFLGKDNGEMAFAQAFQSMCSLREPLSHMNPVLLKPISDGKIDVVVFGKSQGPKTSSEYWKSYKARVKDLVFDEFSKILKRESNVIIEGAGSCSEVNMKPFDFSNTELCKNFSIPFLVVADIYRGGVFAKIVGTYEIFDKKEKDLLCGFIINKMVGDKSLLKDGIDFVEKKTGKKVLGVIPFVPDLKLPPEDELDILNQIGILDGKGNDRNDDKNYNNKKIKVYAVKTPYLSNYFDFYPFIIDDNFEFRFALYPSQLDDGDLIVLGGSRNVFYDLKFLKEKSFAQKIMSFIGKKKNKLIIAICGGYEFFFRKILDKLEIEGNGVEEGLGLISEKIEFQREKITRWRKIKVDAPFFSGVVEGFDLRHGRTSENLDYFSYKNFFGTFLHSIFWNDDFRFAILKYFGVEEQKPLWSLISSRMEKWSDLLKQNLDLNFIESLLS